MVVYAERILLVVLCFAFVAGCGQTADQPSYKDQKKMVMDILKSDDGKQAVREMLEDKELRRALVFDEAAVRKAILESMTTQEGKKLWQDLLSDPDFSMQLAEVMQDNNEKLLKRLMKDPQYQEMMMDIIKAPELQNQYLDLLKTQPFREQLEQNVTEMLDGPAFRKKIIDLIGEAIKKQNEETEQ